MELDRKTIQKIQERAKALSKDKEFLKKIDEETKDLDQEQLRDYISRSAELSEAEVRN